MKKIVIALIASVAAMGAAQAQDANTPRYYVGAGVASADHDFKLSGATSVDSDDWKASGKVFGGYEFDQNWGVEAGYTDYRKSHANYTLNGVQGRADSSGHSFYLAGKYAYPIDEKWSAYGKLGAQYTTADLRATDSFLNRKEHDTGVYAGVGLQYNINKQVALTAEYERYGKEKAFGAKADVLTVGARYAF